MGETVDARDVLDANAMTRIPFRGRVVGYFQRVGPNSWDPYARVEVALGPELEVRAETPIELESTGARFRMRRRGEVIVVDWQPDAEGAGAQTPDAQREAFLRTCIRGDDPTPEGNLGLWMYAEQRRDSEPKE